VAGALSAATSSFTGAAARRPRRVRSAGIAGGGPAAARASAAARRCAAAGRPAAARAPRTALRKDLPGECGHCQYDHTGPEYW
jgi:hypothetical protein